MMMTMMPYRKPK